MTKYVLLDTTCLFETPFESPDFQRLLILAQTGAVKICIPHIVWEERRTQLVEQLCDKIRKASRAVDDARGARFAAMLVQALPPPQFSIWTPEEVQAQSRLEMTKFAEMNNIEILDLGADHAGRAWQRYFDAEPPFDRAQERKLRRQDIPDSWILESAIDLATRDGEHVAVCNDGKLSTALATEGFETFKSIKALLDSIEVEGEVSDPEGPMEAGAMPKEALDLQLAQRQQTFAGLDVRILGLIAYFDGVSKEQLRDVAIRAGIDARTAENVAQRLAITGVVEDTGNHYLPKSRALAAAAVAQIEGEIISLLKQ